LPWKTFQLRTSTRRTLRGVRVVIADPPAYTPPYDHELAAALARSGVDVELATSRFRFGEAAPPEGYERRELFYPLSSRLGGSRLRLPLKALEHPVGLARLRATGADVLHLQWLASPELDLRLLRHPAPLVFTAHDLLPRRTARKHDLWRRLFDRFERVVVHSERGRATLAGLGVPEEKLRVIRHPVFRSDPARADDGRTVLALGLMRPYKQLEHAEEAARRAGARLLLTDADGYVPRAEIERALGESTVAVFPYKPELDQSGALLQALGAGLPAVVYDVGGLGEVVREFEAGRVVRPDDVEGLAGALGELLDDEGALAAARAGARRARDELTWDAAARAHLDLYRELR
jgi:glycosyltransferase involved in cell wall biosynthesis